MQRTFTIHPDADSGETPSLVLSCDPISDDDALVLIGTEEIKIIGQLSQSSNAALLGRIETDDTKISVVIKPSMYENPLYDFPWGTLARREVASYELSQLFGWRLVPPTVLRDVHHMESSVQLFIPHNPRHHYFTLSSAHHDAIERCCVFDYVVNNADRKAGHIVCEESESFEFYSSQPETPDPVPTGHIWGIDHGLTFHSQDKLRTVIWEFAEQPISEELLIDLARCEAVVAERLSPLLEDHEIEKTCERIQTLLLNPFHRAFDGSERAFPWPLV